MLSSLLFFVYPRLQHMKIPIDFDYRLVVSLSAEEREKLTARKPATIGMSCNILLTRMCLILNDYLRVCYRDIHLYSLLPLLTFIF